MGSLPLRNRNAASERPSGGHPLRFLSGTIKSWQWYCMPTTVFLIGLLSIILLLWADRINGRLRSDSRIVDAIMDVQIHTATGHLWLEESVNRDTDVTNEQVIADLDQAIKLIDVTLSGGEAEHTRISEPLKDPELRTRAQSVKSLLINFKTIGLVRLQNSEISGIGSAVDRQFDAVFMEILSKARELEDIIEIKKAGDQEKARSLFIGILIIWTFIVVVATSGLWSRERERKSTAEALLRVHEQLLSQAEELTCHREHLAELVEKRTAELKAANERIRVEMGERLQTCETLKETEQQVYTLSSRLLTAQEIERRRIAMELHDELGQALNVTKLRIRMIEKGLREDQRPVREECEELLEYMDCVIEDVRRLSLALSPTVLEDLGLTSALRWLTGNLARYPYANVHSNIEEIDRFFPEKHWVTIYRVVQETLTNIEKHAQAENVSIDIRRCDDKVTFSVVDDGKGFELDRSAMKESSERGFGLTTMNERVRLMGGDMELSSGEGDGTRIVFSIPIEKGEA